MPIRFTKPGQPGFRLLGDHEVAEALPRSRELGTHAGVVRAQPLGPESGQVASDRLGEAPGLVRVDVVVDRVDVGRIRSEANPPTEVEGRVNAEPRRGVNRVDEMRRREAALPAPG